MFSEAGKDHGFYEEPKLEIDMELKDMPEVMDGAKNSSLIKMIAML